MPAVSKFKVAHYLAFFFFYLPWVLCIRGRIPHYAGLGFLRLLAIVPLVVRVYIALRSAFAFAWEGRGTPAPFDPPRSLVVTAFYRYVRNPMYVGAVLTVIGETTLFGSVVAGLEYAFVFATGSLLFVLFYEEPALRRKFGAEYEEYCRHVPRFIPRVTPGWPVSKA